jgi:proteic killer suppression protein
MIIQFKSSKLKKQCENPARAAKDFGADIGRRLIQRINELESAVSLNDIKMLPSARLHRLQGNRSNSYAVDLVHPFRLIFSPIKENKNGEYRLAEIRIIRIEEVVDYHGD